MMAVIETPIGVFYRHECPGLGEPVVLPCSHNAGGAAPRVFRCEWCETVFTEDDD